METVRLIAVLILLAFNLGCVSPIAISAMGTIGSSTPMVFHSSGWGKGESFLIASVGPR